MDRQTKREILLLAFGTILAEAPLLAIAAVKRNRKDPICFSPYLYRARRMPSPRPRARIRTSRSSSPVKIAGIASL
jgi:hypothetical protein